MEEKSKLDQEIATMKDNSDKSIAELKSFSLFFKIFSTSFREQVNSIKEKIGLYTEKNIEEINQSLLSTNLNSIADNFNIFNENSKNLLTKIQNELINTLEEFTNDQMNIYQENNEELNKLYLNYNINRKIFLNSKNNYYKSFYNAKKQEIEQAKKLEENININEEEMDMLTKDKMEAKNNKTIYKYELEKYNKIVDIIGNNYSKIKDKIETAEKSRITFIKTSFDKYKKFWNNYGKIINEYIDAISILFSDDICNKIEQENVKEISKFTANTKQEIVSSKQDFISYNEFCEKSDNSKKDKNNLVPITSNFDKNINIKQLNKKEKNEFYNKLLNDLMGEEEVGNNVISQLIEIFQYQNNNEDCEKDFIEVLVEKNKTSLKFQNLKNLELLSTPISYITLKQSSIFDGNFELNFKIIFIAERFFYQNKVNNNKVYLSAILSKNKFYRTKLFWRNILELKLVNKLDDHILRLKNVVLPGEKPKGLFGNLFGANNANAALSQKNSLLSKTRIISLIKGYKDLDQSRINILDKMAPKEMYTILKTSIPNFSNFNFPSIPSLDLISKLSQEYKMSNDQINYFVIYYKVSNHTIRQLLPHGISLGEENENIDKNNNIKIKHIKIMKSVIPFLSYQDYNNLLLTGKFYNKKLKKKIYKYVLKQKNTSMKTRLQIWYNLLKINELKKKYNYKDVLSKANDPKNKHEIELDIRRTNVNEDQKELHKERITNILYAVSQCNFGIKYVQGMNFIVAFLYELYGEEEAFNIFLSFFHSTEYSIIFDKDLFKLKEFFYVFNRLISLFEPELSSSFNMNGVNVNFFATPWFITLFTGSHQKLRDDKDNKNILIRIFDNYICSGWKSMMVVGCSLLHSFEHKLMSLKYEDMLDFLINGMLRSEFFMAENEANLENYFENIKVSKKLIRNIELEYKQEKMLNNESNNIKK